MDDRNDLFSPLGKRAADPLVRVAKRDKAARDASDSYTRGRHRGAGRAGAGAPPAGHVYRRHRREGAAPSVRRSDRQCDGRGGRRPCHLDRGRARRGRLRDRHRQRPRHPGRSAPEVQEQVGARGHHDARCTPGGKFDSQGLRDLGRPARRRRLGGQRAVGRARGRGGARPAALRAARSRAASRRASCRSSARQNRRGTRCASTPIRRSSARARVQAGAAVPMARSKAYLFGGVEIRWTLRPGAASRPTTTCPRRRRFHFPGGLKRLSSQPPRRAMNAGRPTIFAGKVDKPGGHGAVEWAIAWSAGDGFSAPTATPSRPPKAARTRRACATR